MQHLKFIAKTARGKIDAHAGTISSVSVLTSGMEAIGHGINIDQKSLVTCMSAANQIDGGVKVKVNHGADVTAIVGALRNFRIVGDQLLADLHLLKTSPFRGQVLEWAAQLPASFGLSIDFTYQPEEINGKTFVRVTELSSCDLVDSPAANPRGLFLANAPGNDRVTDNIKGDTAAGFKNMDQARRAYRLLESQFKTLRDNPTPPPTPDYEPMPALSAGPKCRVCGAENQTGGACKKCGSGSCGATMKRAEFDRLPTAARAAAMRSKINLVD